MQNLNLNLVLEKVKSFKLLLKKNMMSMKRLQKIAMN